MAAMGMRLHWLLILCVMILALAGPVLQNIGAEQEVSIEPRQKPDATASAAKQRRPDANLRVDTSLVLVPVTVTDSLGRPVVGLEKSNFRVFEDQVPQTIKHFAMDDEPLAIGFIFDTSGSMGGTLGISRLATRPFFEASEPGDEFCLVEFDTKPRLMSPLTEDTRSITEQLLFTHSGGSTALLDAVVMAVHEIKKSTRPKKALVLFSDGGENHSRYNLSEIKNVLRESDVLLYSVGPNVYDEGGGLLKILSEQTGGRLIEWGPNLPDLAKKIIVDLRNRYVLAYSPPNRARDGRFHSIRVQTIPPRGFTRLHAHWRTGYYAPYE